MKNRAKILAAVITAAFLLSGMTAFAQSNEQSAIPTSAPNEIVIEDSKTLTPNGNAQLLDDVTDNEKLQFITVTARDGSVFYIVIDRGSTSENVYFLNTVDESDLAALVKDYTPQNLTVQQTEPQPSTSPAPEQEKSNQPAEEKKSESNNSMFLIILLLAGAAGIGGYYYKVILPKKKLEQADDIEDFEFEEETVNEDETDDVENE